MDYLVHIVILIGIYIILAISLDLVVGHTGILSIAHGAFYAVGAYTVGLLAIHFNFPMIGGLVISLILGAVASLFIALPALRIGGFYLIITSFAFQMILHSILQNWISLTRGPAGLVGIPNPLLFGHHIESDRAFLVVACIVVILVILLCKKLVNSTFGKVLRAIRDDEVAVAAIGKNVTLYKVTILIIGGALASLAGGLYAYHMRYVNPDSFTLDESFFILALVLVGGAGTLWGPLLAAVVLVAVPEVFRFIGLPGYIAGPVRQILYAALLIVVLRVRPEGLVKPTLHVLRAEEE